MLKRYPVIMIILLLAVGYAGVTTKHLIDGNINVGYNTSDFNVVFARANDYNGTSSISADEKSVTLKTANLLNVDDEAQLEFDVANKSLEYDATATIECGLSSNSASYNEYLNIDIDVESPVELSSGEETTGMLTVKMKKAYTGSSGIAPELTCNVSSTPSSRTEEGKTYKPIYKETALKGAYPVLDNEKLLPVNIANDGTATVADVKEEWYNYANKEWANAVILVDNPSKKYNINEPIAEDDIESYFVWIPRFRYLIFDEGNYTNLDSGTRPTESNAKEIQIEFENKNSKASTGSTKDSWLTHPAFTNYNTNGIWVGKFETGYAGATDKASAQKDEIDASKIIIKPNSYSWRSISVSNILKTTLAYETNFNSHMMRNTEWGAIAYFSHSKYGINGELRINNHSGFMTGFAANVKGAAQSATDFSAYNTDTGYLASTTGNITGIYDISGGAWEYVAGYKDTYLGSSGFTEEELITYANYLDVYPSDSTRTTYNYRILGDATGELGPFYNAGSYVNNWYNGLSVFLFGTNSWFLRGGGVRNGSSAGAFYFNSLAGGANADRGFRIILAF